MCLNKGYNEEPVLFRKERDIFFKLVENCSILDQFLKHNPMVQYLTNKRLVLDGA